MVTLRVAGTVFFKRMPLLLIALTALIPGTVTAAMDQLTWSECSDLSGTSCATLEFCQDGSVFTYRLPGETECGGIAPLIRITAGKKYRLTMRNLADLPGNIHTHGLHISGSGNADDPKREALPGEGLHYHWNLRSDLSPGTNWYHAHAHGFTEAQVSGGAFGMLIVDPASPEAPGGDANIQAWLDNELLLVAATVAHKRSGNGIAGGDTFELIQDEWYRFRVITADPWGHPLDLGIPTGCTGHAMAYDGVWRFTVPKMPASNSFKMTGASRMDIALKCTVTGSHLVELGYIGNDKTVATLNVVAGTPSSASPFTAGGGSWTPTRPHYLRDLTSETVDQTFEVETTATTVNGRGFSPTIPLPGLFYYDTIQEWDILDTYEHPFHLHVFHMQIVTPGGCGHHEYGEYYDTIATDIPHDCLVRFHMINYGEHVMMHCHKLVHEDSGAMGWIDVKPNPDASHAVMPVTDTFDTAAFTLATPTASPTQAPTTKSPIIAPTVSPTISPTTSCPTLSPTTLSPTTSSPTTLSPTPYTSVAPTSTPTHSPTVEPTLSPTLFDFAGLNIIGYQLAFSALDVRDFPEGSKERSVFQGEILNTLSKQFPGAKRITVLEFQAGSVVVTGSIFASPADSDSIESTLNDEQIMRDAFASSTFHEDLYGIPAVSIRGMYNSEEAGKTNTEDENDDKSSNYGLIFGILFPVVIILSALLGTLSFYCCRKGRDSKALPSYAAESIIVGLKEERIEGKVTNAVDGKSISNKAAAEMSSKAVHV